MTCIKPWVEGFPALQTYAPSHFHLSDKLELTESCGRKVLFLPAGISFSFRFLQIWSSLLKPEQQIAFERPILAGHFLPEICHARLHFFVLRFVLTSSFRLIRFSFLPFLSDDRSNCLRQLMIAVRAHNSCTATFGN